MVKLIVSMLTIAGLDMIKIIKDVRERVRRESGVDVNMRIGVHSGNIISGILGTNKLQFDVWSRDVVIANKMEQTGKPGKVHVTQQTLDLVDATEYDCVPVESLNDEILNKYDIRSYLITPSIPVDSTTTQVRISQWRRKPTSPRKNRFTLNLLGCSYATDLYYRPYERTSVERFASLTGEPCCRTARTP